MQSHLCHLFSFLSHAINTTELIRRGCSFSFFIILVQSWRATYGCGLSAWAPREANSHMIRNKETLQYMSSLDTPSCKASSCHRGTPPYDRFSFQLWLSILSSAFLSCKYLIMKMKLQDVGPMGPAAPPKSSPNLDREKDMTEIAVRGILVF